MKKRLYKSREDQKIDGVCAGIAKYFDLDPTIVRLLWVLVTLCGGAGVIAYIVCVLVIPREPEVTIEDYADYTNIDIDDERGVR